MNILKLNVIEKIKETGDSFSFVFRLADNSKLAYKSGQYLPIKIPHESGILFRSYSISSSPDINDDVKITVRREKGGKGSNWLCDNLNVGDLVESLLPAGEFFPQSWDEPFALFAGGSGITPIISIIKTALLKSNNKMKLFYANSSTNSVIFEKELKELSLKYHDRLKIDFWMDQEKGIPTERAFEFCIDSNPKTRYFLCGPAPFMGGVEKFLIKSNIPIESITKESFTGSVSTEPVKETDNSHKNIRVSVILNGIKTEVMCSEDDYILDEILKTGINVPNSCGVGNCGSCICSLISGDVVLESNAVFSGPEIEDGWTLACRSKPRSNDVEISFDEL